MTEASAFVAAAYGLRSISLVWIFLDATYDVLLAIVRSSSTGQAKGSAGVS